MASLHQALCSVSDVLVIEMALGPYYNESFVTFERCELSTTARAASISILLSVNAT